MCQMTVNKQEKFHGDRTIGGAVTVKKAFKNTIFQLYMNVIVKNKCSYSHTYTSYLYHMIDLLILNNFVSRITAINQSVIKYAQLCSKPTFCKLVLGFSPNRNKTTAEMFSGQ